MQSATIDKSADLLIPHSKPIYNWVLNKKLLNTTQLKEVKNKKPYYILYALMCSTSIGFITFAYWLT